MVKVKSLLKGIDKELDDEDSKIISVWIKTKKREIRSCQKTLTKLKTNLKKALEKEVDDFAEELLDDRFTY